MLTDSVEAAGRAPVTQLSEYMTNREAGTPRAARGDTSGVGAARTLLMDASARAVATEVIMRVEENISRT